MRTPSGKGLIIAVAAVALCGAAIYALTGEPDPRPSASPTARESAPTAVLPAASAPASRHASAPSPTAPASAVPASARVREGAAFGWLVEAHAGAAPAVTLSLGDLVPVDEFAEPGGPAAATRSTDTTTLAFAPEACVSLADGRTLTPEQLAHTVAASADHAFIARLHDGKITELVEYAGTPDVSP